VRHPDAFVRKCRDAEAAGIESLHLPHTNCLSDALKLAVTAGQETSRLGFRVGRDFSGVMLSLTGRELREAFESLGGRLIVHMSFHGEDPSRNDPFPAAAEFIANCRNLFESGRGPEFHVEGDSSEAAFLAIKYADCLWRRPHRQNQVHADALPVLHFGKEVGLACAVIAGETWEEALEALRGHLSEENIERLSNPAQWLTPDLFLGSAPGAAGANISLLGSFDKVVRTIYGFKHCGISHFMVREWPGHDEMNLFAARIMPLIRAFESGRSEN
jgi:hypothetical protein